MHRWGDSVLPTRTPFSVEKNREVIGKVLPDIIAIANGEKDALGFIPRSAYPQAVANGRIIVMLATNRPLVEVAGFILFGGVFPHASIQQIAVKPEYRCSGVASSLMAELVSDLERLGYLTIKAKVASDLPVAQAFYEKSGFEAAYSRPGGQARNRQIVVRVRQLETDSLFTRLDATQDVGFALGITGRSAGESPFYTFDLNVLFDLVKNRARHEIACQLFSAALAHQIRLVVASEFLTELERTSNVPNDPVLQMALRLPRLPEPEQSELETLAERIHGIVFPPSARETGTEQAWSDARHIAHSALAHAAGFITSDGRILEARNKIFAMSNLDVASLDELVALLPTEQPAQYVIPAKGQDFECTPIGAPEFRSYVENVLPGARLPEEIFGNKLQNSHYSIRAIIQEEKTVGVASILIPQDVQPIAKLFIHIDPYHSNSELYFEYLLEVFIHQASKELPVTIELVHVPGQSLLTTLAKARGFQRMEGSQGLVKVAAGKPMCARNWTEVVRQIRRRTGLKLPAEPSSPGGERRVSVINQAGDTYQLTLNKLEDLLSPTVIIWPGRTGVIAPITRAYADDLLGTSNQFALPFVKNRDVAFLTRRGYVNSPRTAPLMRPERPLFFYESGRSGGRGAVVAVARIVDALVMQKSEVQQDHRRRLVVDDLNEVSKTDDVLVTTFDNLMPLQSPVPLKKLRDIGAAGGANLVTASALSSDQMEIIIESGYRNAR